MEMSPFARPSPRDCSSRSAVFVSVTMTPSVSGEVDAWPAAAEAVVEGAAAAAPVPPLSARAESGARPMLRASAAVARRRMWVNCFIRYS